MILRTSTKCSVPVPDDMFLLLAMSPWWYDFADRDSTHRLAFQLCNVDRGTDDSPFVGTRPLITRHMSGAGRKHRAKKLTSDFLDENWEPVLAEHDASVIEQDLQFAKFLFGMFDHLLTAIRGGYVSMEITRMASLLVDQRYGFFAASVIDVDGNNGGTVFSKQ